MRCARADLSAIFAAYGEARGQPPYHPVMMVALLLYAYSAVYSSRRIARGCEDASMAVTGMQRPDFRTISDFRKRHLAALSGLFAQVLALCRRAGLVKLGHVAPAPKANASKHKAMSYARMVRAEAGLEAVVESWLDRAAAADAAEDEALGVAARGDEMPAWVADKAKRLAKIRAKAALEAEARDAAARAAQTRAPKRPGPKPKPPADVRTRRSATSPTPEPHPQDQGRLHPGL